ncbi:MAG: primosomal replication protein N, partial [Kingella oralis]
MNNQFQLTAKLHKVDVLRYTPAGVPVLDVVLQHESMQE